MSQPQSVREVSVTFTSRTIADYSTQASLNRVPGPGICRQAAVGVIIGMSSNEVATVWDNGGIRVPLASAQEVFVSSTDANDTSLVFIRALDADYKSVILTATLNGQTQVRADFLGGPPVSSPVIHVQTAVTAAPPPPQGDVYVAIATPTTGGIPDDIDTLQSRIIFPNNITRNCTFVVPDGKFAALIQFRGNTNGVSKPVALTVATTVFGQNRVLTTEFTVAADFPGFNFPVPVATADFLGTEQALFPSRTNIDFIATSQANGTDVNFGAAYLLFGNEYLEE